MDTDKKIKKNLKALEDLLANFKKQNDMIYQELLDLKTKISNRKSEQGAQDIRDKINNF